jgi:hypothetical protein
LDRGSTRWRRLGVMRGDDKWWQKLGVTREDNGGAATSSGGELL